MSFRAEGDAHDRVERLYHAAAEERLWPCIVTRLKNSPWQPGNPFHPVYHQGQSDQSGARRLEDSAGQHAYSAGQTPVPEDQLPMAINQIPFDLARSVAADGDIPAGSARLPADRIAALGVPNINARPDLTVLGSAAAMTSQQVSGETAAENESLLHHTFLALRIARKLEDLREEEHALKSGIGRMAVGMLLVDCDKRVSPLNDEARAILARRELALWGGRLTTADKRARIQLEKLLAGLTGEETGRPQGGGVTIRRLNGHALQIWGVPLRKEERTALDPSGRPCGLLFAIDPDRAPRTPDHLLMEAFGLTRAETALTLALLNGETVDEYCERTGISRNTARTHMRAIFDKLGIKKQTELIRLLSGFRMLHMGERG